MKFSKNCRMLFKICMMCAAIAVSSFMYTQAEDAELPPAAMSRIIKENHPAPFTKMPEDVFDAQVEELIQKWATLDEQDAYFSMRKIAAGLGDEHTMLLPPAKTSQPELPFFVMVYDGHWMIVQAQQEYEKLVGKELTAINGTDISDIEEMLLPYISCETEQWAEEQCSLEIRSVQNLQYIGVMEDASEAVIRARDLSTGEETELKAETLAEGYDYQNSAFYPMAQTLAQSGYYYGTLLEDGSAFIQYNVCAENPQMPMKIFAKELERQLLSSVPGKVIVDLRHNSGGDSEVIRPLLETLKKLQEKGSRLYCLTGPQTFSSGVMNALDIQQVGALLVGEPTGGVLGFGELLQEELPDGSILCCSTKDFSSVYGISGPVLPDVEVIQTAEDFLAGKDTVVEYIKNQVL